MTKQAEFIFDMGDEVEDVISGFKGTVIGRYEYLTGCNHYGVEAKAKDGDTPKYDSIDEQRLKLVKAGAVTLARKYGSTATEAAPARTSPGPSVPRTPARPA
jgi:hypothetical protein